VAQCQGRTSNSQSQGQRRDLKDEKHAEYVEEKNKKQDKNDPEKEIRKSRNDVD
jgi:hypothetical protein